MFRPTVGTVQRSTGFNRNGSRYRYPMTPLSRFLMATAVKAEAALARLFAGGRVARRIIAYHGYATPDNLIVLGRVLASPSAPTPRDHQGRLRNFRDMLLLFATSEVAHAGLIVDGKALESDEEGYFTLSIPRNGRDGVVDIEAFLPGVDETVQCHVFAPPPRGPAIVISDIDDTILHTGAYSLVRNLWTSMTGNSLTRLVFPDAAEILRKFHEGGHPVNFVSSSPWNLFDFLRTIFDRAGIPRGPMFLRDMGLSADKFITAGHGNHKGQAIDTLLDANPQRQAILIGDTGQKDAQIYRAAIQRHANRIRAVILRVPANGLDATDKADIAALEATGVPVLHGNDFRELLSKTDLFQQ